MNPNCESFPSGSSKSQPWKKDWPPTLKASTVGHGDQGGNIGEKIYNLGSGLIGPDRGKLYDVGREPEKLVLTNESKSISTGLTLVSRYRTLLGPFLGPRNSSESQKEPAK